MLVKLAGSKKGKGLLNKLIDKLPVELHLPGYNFCGPGTRLEQRLARGDAGVNQLDEACKKHDITYQKYSDTLLRRQADKLLAQESLKRVTSRNASLKERAAALGVAAAMKLKTKLGMAVKTKRKRLVKKGRAAITFNKAVSMARKSLIAHRPKSIKSAAQLALRALRPHKKYVRKPTRVIPIPTKMGGFIGLAALLGGLSAAGSLAGGASAVVKAINEVKNAKAELDEKKRHNIAMETKRVGNGLIIKPYKKGLGFYLKPHETKNC